MSCLRIPECWRSNTNTDFFSKCLNCWLSGFVNTRDTILLMFVFMHMPTGRICMSLRSGTADFKSNLLSHCIKTNISNIVSRVFTNPLNQKLRHFAKKYVFVLLRQHSGIWNMTFKCWQSVKTLMTACDTTRVKTAVSVHCNMLQ